MTWQRWQSLLMVLLWLLQFTLGDAIGWAFVIAIFVLICSLIFFLIRRALRGRHENGNDITVLLAQIAVMDERIKQLQAQLSETIKQRDDLKRQAREYAALRREVEGVPELAALVEEQLPAQIKVLLVAPHSSLPLADAEAQDVQRSGLEVTPVYSPVGVVTLTREILASNHDGLWLAGHMDDQGNFLLDNGELLSSSALTSLVRGRFQWCFLHSCQSIFAAQALQNETDADVICTVIPVPDIDAYRTGSLFANWLAKLGDVRAAYEQSRPGGNRVYVFLSSARQRILVAKK